MKSNGKLVRSDVKGAGRYTPPEEKDPEFWRSLARSQMLKRIDEQNKKRNKKAKNIIMFLGDGMSLNTVTAARILKGQRQNKTGEESFLFFEEFPIVGLSKTYCTNSQVADSACSATAYLTGVKTNFYMAGVTAEVEYNNCSASSNPANHVSSLADWAQKAGKSTGIISTTSLTHASPSGAYGHVASRYWESDSDIIKYAPDVNPADCMDLAQQLITQLPGINFDIMMSGGMGKFLPKDITDAFGKSGERSDGKNLLNTWQSLHPQGKIVTNRTQLLELDLKKTTNILGLFHSGLMDFNLLADTVKQPSLADMTEVSIKKLSQNPQGYFVFIEGGLIDQAHHGNVPHVSLDETLEFEKAIKLAREMTNPEDTLIVVTSDHAHPMSIAGYPNRGNDILGLNDLDRDLKGIPYATLNYALGRNTYVDVNGNRMDLTGTISKNANPATVYPSQINTQWGEHGGDDVGIYASGPYEHLFTGLMDQNTIPHLMAYAACIGDGPTSCKRRFN